MCFPYICLAMRSINLNRLKKGTPGITEVVGAYLAQATAYFLEKSGHTSGVILELDGLFEEQVQLIWSDKIDEQVQRSWKDKIEAVEYAAVGIATLLVELLIGLKVV